jgi:hypothetical protein
MKDGFQRPLKTAGTATVSSPATLPMQAARSCAGILEFSGMSEKSDGICEFANG